MSDRVNDVLDNPYVPLQARITSVVDLTDKEKLFEIRIIDEQARDAFAFGSGQFVELSILGVGEAPISITSAPTKRGSFELCVREVGDVTKALHQKRCGDTVSVRGPFGRGFPFDRMKGHDVLLVAGGLGIAPLRSLIDHIRDERHEFGNVTIMYGVKNPGEVLFGYEFESWRTRDDFDLVMTVDEPDAAWKGEVGPVTRLFDGIAVDPSRTYGAICGPPAMYPHVIAEMRKKEMDVERIYVSFERRMKCGIGKCGHCGVGHKYTCVDGPVFSYWEAMNLREAI